MRGGERGSDGKSYRVRKDACTVRSSAMPPASHDDIDVRVAFGATGKAIYTEERYYSATSGCEPLMTTK